MKKLTILFSLIFLCCISTFSQASVWEIKKGKNILYLGGSIHVLRENDFPLPAAFETAFEKSDILVIEAEIDKVSNDALGKMISQFILPQGQTLKTVLNDTTYQKLKAECEKYSLPIESLQHFKPGMVMNILSLGNIQKLGFTAQGVDNYFLSKANEKKKKLNYLETVEFQLSLLANMGNRYENEFVEYYLEDFDKIETELLSLVSGWKNGTSTEIEVELKDMQEKFPTVYKDMFTDRNNNWIPKIEKYLSNSKVEFVIVGLAHMYGTDGLLAQLQQKGYEITQLK